MAAELELKTEHYFAQHFGVTLDALLAPIGGDDPGGANLRGNGVYRDIQEARREDDPTIPMGPWVRELKRADWDRVGKIAVEALACKSKDLRLATWLLEAQIHRHGFAAIAPCLTLIDFLCQHYWEYLYPRAEGADIEYRTNVIHWANEKLQPVLRMVPITQTGRDEAPLTWADWEQARRNDQLRASHGDKVQGGINAMSGLTVATALAGTPTDWLAARFIELSDAALGIERLTETLNTLCEKDSPSLQGLAGLLEQIQMLIDAELRKRGVVVAAEAEPDAAPEEDGSAPPPAAATPAPGGLHDRASAYARLVEIADYLMRIEPHSPVPYLINRAVAWGNLNTADLYRELFVKFGGQLNIFEMLGLQPDRKDGGANEGRRS